MQELSYQTAKEHQSAKERFEQIKHDFAFGLAPTKDEDKIVLHHEGYGYAHYRVRVVFWPEALRRKYTMRDVAIVASGGDMPFGWRTDGNSVCIHTD